MFNLSFYETVKNHNNNINTINRILREIEKDIAICIENDPAIVLYSYDPLLKDANHFFEFDYPNITFSLFPFKAVISYKEIIALSKEKLNNYSTVEQVVEKLILENINIMPRT